jgi:hypothetical protein
MVSCAREEQISINLEKLAFKNSKERERFEGQAIDAVPKLKFIFDFVLSPFRNVYAFFMTKKGSSREGQKPRQEDHPRRMRIRKRISQQRQNSNQRQSSGRR